MFKSGKDIEIFGLAVVGFGQSDNNTSTIYIIVYYVNSSVVENHHYISTPLDETLKRLDYIGLVKGIR